ncbi:unnamed protein product [Colias eurytheme]|nr:unnamed protein product [Colias eurytheme]
MNSFLDSKYFNRYKRLHPLTAAALQILHFEQYLSTTNETLEAMDELLQTQIQNASNQAALIGENGKKVRRGAFEIRRTAVNFARSPVDLTLEQTINADASNQLADNLAADSIYARQRWALSHSMRTKILTSMKQDIGLRKKDDTSHSLQQSKIKKDKKTLNNIIEAIKRTMNPFDDAFDKGTLFNISTGKAASKEVADFLVNVKTADGCAGQNKNTGMLSMLGHVKRVEIIFLVVGHSFLPADRVFAKIEKQIKRKEIIASPSEYTDVLKDHCKVTNLTNIPVYDWKESYEKIVKPTTSWHFPFQKTKRLLLTRNKKLDNIILQGEMTYRKETGINKIITKKNKTIQIIKINPNIIQPNNIILKPAKIRDVCNLLKKHYGKNWRELELLYFYKELEYRNRAVHVENEDEEEDIIPHLNRRKGTFGFEDENLMI